MKLYIAGSSAEMVRAAAWHVKARADGFDVLSTWVDVIGKVGEGNPRDVSPLQRQTWAVADFMQVSEADVLWFLVPPKGKETRGAWAELGFAAASDLLIICSGDTKQSIFCALGAEHEDDHSAYAALLRLDALEDTE